ncbi:MAG: cytochrome b/b6 domain-containing protein [Mycobacteriaceae bacterium]
MSPPPEVRVGVDHSRDVLRFVRAERWAHGVAGVLTLVCIVTAAILYNGMFAVLIGNRRLVELVHVWSGFALPVPLLVALLSRAYRSDLRRLGRFVAEDWLWLRSARRRARADGVGKFNAGQKLNGSLSAGSILVLLGTGTIMFFTGLAPLAQRTGATFVHDWFALAFGLLVVGHVVKALRDPQAMRGIRTGWVHRAWVHHEHPSWESELAERANPDRGTGARAPERERPPPPQE